MRLVASVEVDGTCYHIHASGLTMVSGTLVIQYLSSDRTLKRALVDMHPIFYNSECGHMVVSNNSIREWVRNNVHELEFNHV